MRHDYLLFSSFHLFLTLDLRIDKCDEEMDDVLNVKPTTILSPMMCNSRRFCSGSVSKTVIAF